MENEQNVKMGRFICELRKEKKLTQKNLAEKLEVTDKAVSKWERGISRPDVSLLVPLSKILGVTTGELLNGERNSFTNKENKDVIEVVEESVVEEALLYSGRNTAHKIERMKRNILVILSASFLIAVVVCVICDFCITKKLTWSLLVIVSIFFGWVILLPIFVAKTKAIKKFLIVSSLAVIPYLLLLSALLHMPIVAKLGACISVISIIGVWCAYAVCIKMHTRKFRMAGILFLILVPVTIAINYAASVFTMDYSTNLFTIIMNVMAAVVLAVICFGIDFFVKYKVD